MPAGFSEVPTLINLVTDGVAELVTHPFPVYAAEGAGGYGARSPVAERKSSKRPTAARVRGEFRKRGAKKIKRIDLFIAKLTHTPVEAAHAADHRN